MHCKKVPGAGIEPAQPCDYRFLRPTRLPIPPPGQIPIAIDLKPLSLPPDSYRDPPPGQIPIAIDLKPLRLPPDSYRDPPHGHRIAKVMKIGELLNKYF